MQVDYARAKIRHFLLNRSEVYKRAVKKGEKAPPITNIARQLQKICPIGERRLQKYLYENTPAKDLQITLEDLLEFAKLAGGSLGSFVTYLGDEPSALQEISSGQRGVLQMLSKLSFSARRELHLRVFDPTRTSQGEEILMMALEISKLDEPRRDAVQRMIELLGTKNQSTEE